MRAQEPLRPLLTFFCQRVIVPAAAAGFVALYKTTVSCDRGYIPRVDS